jgi:hypothetical protein
MQYDWTHPIPQNMDAEEQALYYKLRRISRQTDNPDIWPDGKVWTEDQIADALETEPIKKPVVVDEDE